MALYQIELKSLFKISIFHKDIKNCENCEWYEPTWPGVDELSPITCTRSRGKAFLSCKSSARWSSTHVLVYYLRIVNPFTKILTIRVVQTSKSPFISVLSRMPAALLWVDSSDNVDLLEWNIVCLDVSSTKLVPSGINHPRFVRLRLMKR